MFLVINRYSKLHVYFLLYHHRYIIDKRYDIDTRYINRNVMMSL